MKKPAALTIGIELINDPAWMGGTLYLRNLAIGLSRLHVTERPTIRLFGPTDAIEGVMASGNPRAFANRGRSLFERGLRKLGLLPSIDENVDVFYPGFGPPPGGAVVLRWIPDFQHKSLPHLFQSHELAARDSSIGDVSRTPGVVVLSSAVAAADFQHFFPESLATARIWRFHSLLDTNPAPDRALIERYGLPDKYLYMPNQFWAHKNHMLVLKALALLKSESGMVIPLVCTGAQADRRNEQHFKSIQSFITEHNLDNQVHLLGLLKRQEQIEVLRHCAAVVQPSLFEGWSTVVEDARACGRPILLSDIPVHREQSPPVVDFFDPQSAPDLAKLLLSRWNELSAGPDLASEAKARDSNAMLVLESARAFCAIAAEALEVAHRVQP